MPKGLFEYEVFDDTTMALTLIRACRIKLAVSEEKVTELEDEAYNALETAALNMQSTSIKAKFQSFQIKPLIYLQM